MILHIFSSGKQKPSDSDGTAVLEEGILSSVDWSSFAHPWILFGSGHPVFNLQVPPHRQNRNDGLAPGYLANAVSFFKTLE